MTSTRRVILVVCGIAAMLSCWAKPAMATRYFSVTQATMPANFAMGTAQALTTGVTNTSTAGEAIRSVRFNLVNNNYTLLPNPETFSPAPPTGWSCARSTNARITCTASNALYYITPGTNQNFSFNIINNTVLTQDQSDQMGNATAQFVGSNTWRTATSTSSSWTWKSLSMTLVPSALSIGFGCQFNLTMTVTNKSTASLTGITSVPKPPTRTGVSVTTGSNPASLSLASNATGTMIWTYIAGSTAGAVNFSAIAQDGTGSRTSPLMSAQTVTVVAGASCAFTSQFTSVTPACLFSGQTATFVMTVTNTTGGTLNNITPSGLTTSGDAVMSSISAPMPAVISSLTNSNAATFTWSAIVSGGVNSTYAVSAYALASSPLTTTATAICATQDIDGYIIQVNPSTTYVGSSSQDLDWTIKNYGCGNINQVSIAVPGTWPAPTDSYAVVNNMTGAQDELWSSGPTFGANGAADDIPQASTGDFYLFFATTPVSTGSSTFNITVTDDTGAATTVPVVITVQPFNDSTQAVGNYTDTNIWHEIVP